jgi:hypothetical protein
MLNDVIAFTVGFASINLHHLCTGDTTHQLAAIDRRSEQVFQSLSVRAFCFASPSHVTADHAGKSNESQQLPLNRGIADTLRYLRK